MTMATRVRKVRSKAEAAERQAQAAIKASDNAVQAALAREARRIRAETTRAEREAKTIRDRYNMGDEVWVLRRVSPSTTVRTSCGFCAGEGVILGADKTIGNCPKCAGEGVRAEREKTSARITKAIVVERVELLLRKTTENVTTTKVIASDTEYVVRFAVDPNDPKITVTDAYAARSYIKDKNGKLRATGHPYYTNAVFKTREDAVSVVRGHERKRRPRARR